MKLFKSLKKLGKRSSRRKIAASKKLESKRAAAGKDAIKTNDEPISSPTPVRRDEKRTTKSSVQRTDAPPATPTSNNEPKPVGNPNQEAARRLSSASSVSDVEEVVKKDHSMRNMAVAAMAPLAGAAVAIGAVINHNQEDESIGHGLIGPMGGLNMDTSVVPFTTNDYGSDDNGHAAAAILGVVGVAAAAGTIKAAKSYMGSASDNVSDRKAAMLASNSTASSSLSFSSSEPSGPLTTSPSDNSKPTPADALVAADAVDAFNAGSARSSTTSTSGSSKPVPADALVAADAVDAFNAGSDLSAEHPATKVKAESRYTKFVNGNEASAMAMARRCSSAISVSDDEEEEEVKPSSFRDMAKYIVNATREYMTNTPATTNMKTVVRRSSSSSSSFDDDDIEVNKDNSTRYMAVAAMAPFAAALGAAMHNNVESDTGMVPYDPSHQGSYDDDDDDHSVAVIMAATGAVGVAGVAGVMAAMNGDGNQRKASPNTHAMDSPVAVDAVDAYNADA